MCKHPLLSQAPVFQHFLTAPADDAAWKTGKRTAEKDAVTGDLFALQLQTPEDNKIDATKHQVWLQERTRHNKQVIFVKITFSTKIYEDNCRSFLKVS